MMVDEKLTWEEHINYLCNKLCKLRYAFRSLSAFIDKEMVKQLYFGYVYPHIAYGIELYGTACKRFLKRLQSMQNMLLKTLARKQFRYDTIKLHDELELLQISEIHKFSICMFVYKHKMGMLPSIFKDYFNLNRDFRDRTTRQDNNLYAIKSRTIQGSKTVQYIGARYWNNLPDNIKKTTYLSTFKKSCKRHYLFSYKGNPAI